MRHLKQDQIDWAIRKPHVNQRRQKLRRVLQSTPLEDPSWKRLKAELDQVGAPKRYGTATKPWGIDGRVPEVAEVQAMTHKGLLQRAEDMGLEVPAGTTKAQLVALIMGS